MILPTKIVLWVSPKIYEMKILVFLIYCAHAIVAPPVFRYTMKRPGNRIYEGEDAAPGQFPYHVWKY